MGFPVLLQLVGRLPELVGLSKFGALQMACVVSARSIVIADIRRIRLWSSVQMFHPLPLPCFMQGPRARSFFMYCLRSPSCLDPLFRQPCHGVCAAQNPSFRLPREHCRNTSAPVCREFNQQVCQVCHVVPGDRHFLLAALVTLLRV